MARHKMILLGLLDADIRSGCSIFLGFFVISIGYKQSNQHKSTLASLVYIQTDKTLCLILFK